MSSNCGVCGELCERDAVDIVKCVGGCGNVFHSKCIKSDVEGKKTRSFKDWKCKDCRSNASSNQSASTINVLTKEFLSRVLEDFKNEVFKEFKSFRNDFESLTSSMQVMSDTVDKCNTLMVEMKKDFTALKKENEELRATAGRLTTQVDSLSERLRTLEQYTRRTNLEISGIPVTANECVKDVIRDVGTVLGVEVRDEHIAAAHRVPAFNKSRTPSLIVQLQSKTLRDEWLTKFRNVRPITANQVNSSLPRQPIYVNEHLSPDNKKFLSLLKQKCKELNYKYVWSRDGRFFTRKNQGLPCVKISTQEDIDSLK